MPADRVLTQDELTALLADAAELSSLESRGGPLPAVLDTDFVRTRLHYQVKNGLPPMSVRSAQDGSLRLFMEYDTLTETGERLARFARQLNVPVAQLRGVLNEEWLPHIEVVQLPSRLRAVDPRASQVRDRDPDDFPAAALAALLSPCLLLTHNHKHFGVLSVRARRAAIRPAIRRRCDRPAAPGRLRAAPRPQQCRHRRTHRRCGRRQGPRR